MMRTALALARKGLAVFPCRPRDKRPATEHGCTDATTDAEIVRQWWREQPNANIGVATGKVSGIFVVDVDGVDAEAELRKLETAQGELPPTVEAITPRGRHLFFKMPSADLRNSASKLAPGCDVRADGGYVLCAPSVHPSGKLYAWSVDSSDKFADAPQWLLDKISERVSGNGKTPAPPSQWRALVDATLGEGCRDDTLARLAGYLLRHRVDGYVALSLLQAWNATHCTPPLPEADIERVVKSICRLELKRRGHE